MDFLKIDLKRKTLYLCSSSLSSKSARFLWKRIPEKSKVHDAELNQLWNVGQNLWKRDVSSAYKSLNNYSWVFPNSENMIPIIIKAIRDSQVLIQSYQSFYAVIIVSSFRFLPSYQLLDQLTNQ